MAHERGRIFFVLCGIAVCISFPTEIPVTLRMYFRVVTPCTASPLRFIPVPSFAFPGHEVFAVLTHIDAYAPDGDDEDDDDDSDDSEAAASEQVFLENSAESRSPGGGSGGGNGENGESSSGGEKENSAGGGKIFEGGSEFDREAELPGIIALW